MIRPRYQKKMGGYASNIEGSADYREAKEGLENPAASVAKLGAHMGVTHVLGQVLSGNISPATKMGAKVAGVTALGLGAAALGVAGGTAYLGVKALPHAIGLGAHLTRGIGSGALAGGRLGASLIGKQAHGFGLSPAASALALGGFAAVGLYKTATAVHKHNISRFKTDYDTLEQRSDKDLGATGSLALSFASRAHNLHYLL